MNRIIRSIKKIISFNLFIIQIICLTSCRSNADLKKDNNIGYTEQVNNSSVRKINLSNLYSPYSIVVNLDTNNIIAENSADQEISPASMTKIMTAIVALENIDDLDTSICINEEMFDELYEENASRAGFYPGEYATAKDLIYGALLPSGAECCIALAEYIAGSEENFTDMMNCKAGELGMINTHFTNTTGLTDSNHYSSVGDIAVLLEYALNNQVFYNAFTSSSYTTSPSDEHPEGLTFYSTMFDNLEDTDVTGGRILGGKTGYTDDAGLCLASLACINNSCYICVTAGAAGNHNTLQYNILDAKEVYDFIGEH